MDVAFVLIAHMPVKTPPRWGRLVFTIAEALIACSAQVGNLTRTLSLCRFCDLHSSPPPIYSVPGHDEGSWEHHTTATPNASTVTVETGAIASEAPTVDGTSE